VHKLFAKLISLRPGELRFTLPAFATLFLTVAAHTSLETARDAIFLTQLPTRDLNLVYVALAGITLAVTFVSTKLTLAVGRRNALICSLAGVAAGTGVFFLLKPTPHVALALYLFSGVEGAMLVPQFWLFADDLFTVAQARRLFGSITSGGVAGGVAGAGVAALIVRAFPVTSLLPVTAALFAASAAVVCTLRPDGHGEPRASILAEQPRASAPGPRRSPFRGNPFLIRIAALVSLSTASVLVVDYLFKSAAARAVPPESLGFFFARYYAVMNAVSLVVQIFIAGRVVRRMGVIGASAITPLLLLGAGLTAALQGGFIFVLVLKTFDGGLRYSLNRVATELLYLPVPAGPRQQAKGFIDSALSRIVQALTAIGLYFLAVRWLTSTRFLAVVVIVMCACWLAVALTLRRTYLDLFRTALTSGSLDPTSNVHDIDMTSAGALVESMASTDPVTVVAAMNVLAEHERTNLIPALILYHDAPSVLIRALELMAQGGRTDWVPLGERLLASTDDSVAAATVRALARVGKFDSLKKAAAHPSARVQAYITLYRAQHDGSVDLMSHPLIRAILEAPDEHGRASRRALLAALSDSPDERAINLLLALAELPEIDDDESAIEQLATAIAGLRNPRFVPMCISRLAKRKGRDAIRGALVAIGEPALDALGLMMRDQSVERRLRLHAPRSISPFGSQSAANLLVGQLVREKDGMVRYKVLRALGQLVARFEVKLDRKIIDKETTRNLEEHLRLLSFWVALESERCAARDDGDTAKKVLDGLLKDKLDQSMERAFRLLQIAHKGEDIESVHAATRSSDKTVRANAGEFLDVLLVRHDEDRLRRLLRIVVDDANDVDRIRAAREEIPGLARTYAEAIVRLLDDKDEVLVALAAQHALSLNDPTLAAAVSTARKRSPSIQATTERLFGRPLRGDDAVPG
jgi:AAA family ATP:ADP antiporter